MSSPSPAPRAGREAARQLAATGEYHVVLACRNTAAAERVAAEIRAEHAAASAEVGPALDLGCLQSVAACAAELRSRHPRIDVLVNNAGEWPGQRAQAAWPRRSIEVRGAARGGAELLAGSAARRGGLWLGPAGASAHAAHALGTPSPPTTNELNHPPIGANYVERLTRPA